MKELQEKITKFNKERYWNQFNSPENLDKSISTSLIRSRGDE